MMPGVLTLPFLLVLFINLKAASRFSVHAATTGPAWSLPSLEREWDPVVDAGSRHQIFTPSHMFNNKLEGGSASYDSPMNFECVEPTRALFDQFVNTYNRTFDNPSEKLTRMNFFSVTFRRIILFNKYVKEEILNQSNYELKPEVGNYFYVNPDGLSNGFPWYTDINDCELGLMKKTVFELFYLIDQNSLDEAYRLAIDNSNHLPLLNGDGFEQMANILIVRLQDRFIGDHQIQQLFQWPKYLRKLAAYAYNRRQASHPDFNSRLALVTFAYPTYFKDLKYNVYAANRTRDNLRVHEVHEQFNKWFGRKFSNRNEQNRRLAIFRQRWTLAEELANDNKNSWQNLTIQPDWLRLNELAGSYPAASSDPGNNFNEKIYSAEIRADNQREGSNEIISQFSDLTDAEFVAYITQDFAPINNNKEVIEFLDNNFPIRPLNEEYRWELAAELEFRRQPREENARGLKSGRDREGLLLARRVVDELMRDVGLPFGATSLLNIKEKEYFYWFKKVGDYYKKSYMQKDQPQRPDLPELAEENQRRFEQFKINYGIFQAWFIKEGLNLTSESRQIAMLRLADMSWPEIKLTLFKICCLDRESLVRIGHNNATLQYLSSNADLLCRLLSGPLQIATSQSSAKQEALDIDAAKRELAILELYYYYSVHFNKHHQNMDTFYRGLAIFEHNIQQVKRFSCARSASLVMSFILKAPAESLNNVDTLDPRRMHTDDLNLDRFKYFSVPNLSVSPGDQQISVDEIEQQRANRLPGSFLSFGREKVEGKQADPQQTRDSHRQQGKFFTMLADYRLTQPSSPTAALQPTTNKISSPFRDNLLLSAQTRPGLLSADQWTLRYKLNNVNRIYELVTQRYRYCRRMLGKPSPNTYQQCQSNGKLAEFPDNDWLSGDQLSDRQETDQCAFYLRGLEPWSAGLMQRDPRVAQSLQSVRC